MLGTYDLVNSLHKEIAALWCLVLNPALCFSRPCQDSFALFYEDGLSMTVRYRGHHCTQLCLGVVSPVGRDGRPPTLIRVGPRTEREREREKGREGGREGERERRKKEGRTDPTTYEHSNSRLQR